MDTLVVTIGVAFRDRTWEEYSVEVDVPKNYDPDEIDPSEGEITLEDMAFRKLSETGFDDSDSICACFLIHWTRKHD